MPSVRCTCRTNWLTSPRAVSLFWPVPGGADESEHHSIIYPEPEPGPSGSGQPLEPPAAGPGSGDGELPAAALLCTEESLHSSCPSPGEPAAQLRHADYHVVQDFSVSWPEEVPGSLRLG